MSVEIDETGSDIHAVRVDDLFGLVGLEVADFGNLTVFDADIRPVTRRPSAVDYHAASYDKIEFCHVVPPVDLNVIPQARTVADCLPTALYKTSGSLPP